MFVVNRQPGNSIVIDVDVTGGSTPGNSWNCSGRIGRALDLSSRPSQPF
jgi:hypothetical protein